MSNPPLRAGERHQAAITGCNHQGQGVARVDGFAVFVPGAIPGELVAFTIVQVKARYALAELAEVLEPSPARQVPPCPVYGICGGCQFQHVRYSLQLELKHELVADALRRLGGTEAPVAPTLGMEYPWCYRNHGQFHVAFVQGRNRLGFHAPRTHQVVPAESCPLFSPAVNRILRFVASHPDANTPPAAGPGGSWRRLAVRESLSSGQHLLVFETVDRRWHPGPLAEAVAAAFPSVTSVFWRPAVTGRGQHGRCELVFGGPFLREVLNGLSFRISAESFMQVNTRQAATLFALVREVAALQGGETVVDAYCGTGTIALTLAADARQVIGIESERQAVEDARANAADNSLANVDIAQARVEDWCRSEEARELRPHVVVLDPPRRGCAPAVLEWLAACRAGRVIYVSCDPATLARDLKVLEAAGYCIQSVQPLDMFPQTGHVECVVLMSRLDE